MRGDHLSILIVTLVFGAFMVYALLKLRESEKQVSPKWKKFQNFFNSKKG